MRNLASVQLINAVNPIIFTNQETQAEETAENIVRVGVLGWECVTQKSNNFEVGSKVVYFEVDSLLPAVAVFEFLRKSAADTQFRLKTIKLKGVVSQGLVLPLSLFASYGVSEEAAEGTDLTELLGVEKYEPPVSGTGTSDAKGLFPWFIHKTDETRIQSKVALLTNSSFATKESVITEKLDGQSVTVYYYRIPTDGTHPKLPVTEEDKARGYMFGVCSRNLDLKPADDNRFWRVVKALDVEKKLNAYKADAIVLQGELIGEGVQGNKLKIKGNTICWYDAYDPILKRYYDHVELLAEVVGQLGLQLVPILHRGILSGGMPELLAWADRKSTYTPGVNQEGVVVRLAVEEEIPRWGRSSFKVISPTFLLKNPDA